MLDWKQWTPPGWRDIVADLVRDLDVIARREGLDRAVVTDVKEKWGRLYVSLLVCTDAMEERIEQAEREALDVCIRCGGKVREIRRHGGWMTNLCGTCIAVADLRASISDHRLSKDLQRNPNHTGSSGAE
jgi:hypothetical protein